MAMRYLFGERLYRETLLARPEIKATDILTLTIPMGYISSSTLSWSVKLYENTYNITIETSLDNGETWRPQLPGEQIPGLAEILITKPTKILIRAIVDTTNTVNPADITDITLYIDYPAIGGHYAICSDGRAYFNGQEISDKPDFINLSNGTLKIKGGGRKVDELYVTPRLLTKDEIDLLRQTQYELQDPREGIDAGFRKISHLSGEIDADGHTIYASIHGENKIVAHYGIDTETGDRGLFIYDIDEQGNPVEVGFTGRRADGTVVGFGGGDAEALGGIPAEEFIKAKDYLNIAKPPIAIKKGDVYFPFENSLYSTQGLKPLPGSVATLLPEGGVAVTEGTENLVTNPTEWTPSNNEYQVVEDTGETYLGCKISKTTKLTSSTHANELCTISIAKGETYTASIYQKCLYNAGDGFAGRLVFYYAGTLSTLASAEAEKIGEWERLKVTYANNTGTTLNNVRVYYYPAKTQGSITLTAAPQVEKKPYDTPFVKGTRPDGSLSYNLPISINGDWTIAKWLELEPYFMELNYNNDGVWKCPVLSLGTGFGSSGQGLIGLYGAWFDSDAGKTITFVVDKEGDRLNTRKITLNEEEYNNKIFAVIVKQDTTLTAHLFTSANHHTMEYDISSLGDLSVIKPQLNFHANIVPENQRMYCKRHLNTLVCPYAVSPETIATWYSSNASFYDFSDCMIVFDEEEGVFKVGMAGNLETIASQNYVQSQLENFEPDVKDADSLGGIPAEEFLNSRIVEDGDNENGRYIRWENGLQVCWGTLMVPANTSYSIITMPAAFSGGFCITITNVFWHTTDIVWSTSESVGSTVRVDPRTLGGGPPTVDVYGRFIAIGRWK